VNFVLVKKNALMWSLLSLEFDAKYAKEKLKFKLKSTFKTSLIMPLFLCLYLRILVTSWFYSIHTIKWIFDFKKCNFSVLWTKCVFDSTSHVFGNWLDRIDFFLFLYKHWDIWFDFSSQSFCWDFPFANDIESISRIATLNFILNWNRREDGLLQN
jgi:hypothetical protein